MKIRNSIQLIFILCIIGHSTIYGQIRTPIKSIISIENQYLFAKVDNPIRIVAQQNEPVTINQLSASFQEYDSEKQKIDISEGKGYFIIHPDTVGLVELNIKIGDTIEIKTLRVKPIEAVGKLSKYGAHTDKKINAGEFKAQMGITASVECCGFDATCRVLDFQTIRLNKGNQVDRILNKGGRFEEETKEIIMKAESGDIFIFRQIKYKCPGSNKPQRLKDMIFEIE